jgi:hypothetical protein
MLLEGVGLGLETELSVVLVLVAVSGMSLSSDWLHAIAHIQTNVTNRDLLIENIFNN